MKATYDIRGGSVRRSATFAKAAPIHRMGPATRLKPLACALAAAVSAQPALADPAANALPTNGQVVAGQAAISQAGSAMTIQQGSQRAVINWNSFNIGSAASVHFQQPSSSSVALNRVTGSDASAIYGSLSANGQVYLVNPNGVLFAQGAQVNVGGLVASTLNIRNEDFLAGENRFVRGAATGSVVNQGDIDARYVALLAPEVRNEGIITADMGTVAMAAGDAVTLGITGNQLIDVQVEKASIDTLVENKHLVQANGGTVIMSAQSANALLGQVVNTGNIDVSGISSDGGVVRLSASSAIDHSGKIVVDAGEHGKGGSATLIADLGNPGSRTKVSGTISAKGGSESGDGGFVETSATKLSIASTARIDTRAHHGLRGRWLLDPYDFTVAAGGGDITGADLGAALDMSDVIIETFNGSVNCSGLICGPGNSGGSGDIIINDSVSWTSGSSLTLNAYRDIQINSAMSFGDLDPMMFGFMARLNINYGTGGSGKAVIAQGVDWSHAGTVVDLVHSSAVTPSAGLDTSRDYFLGTTGVDIYVRAISGSGAYGDDVPWGYYADAAGTTRINITTPSGSAVWDHALPLAVSGSPYSLTYSSGISSDRYSNFAAGNAATWTVTPRAITLTADDRSKVYGNVLTLGAGSTAFSLTSGSFVSGESISSVSLSSNNGYAASTTDGQGTYNNEISIDSVVGAGGFNTNNYSITWVDGALTITPRTITVTPTSGQSKIYNGQGGVDPALVYNSIAAQLINGDTVTPTGSLARTAGSNVGNHAIDLGDLASDNANYTLALSPTTVNFAITPKALTMSGLTVPASKVYDGTRAATVSGTPTLQAAEAVGAGSTADGKPYSGDTVNFTGTAVGTYNTKDVATANSVVFSGLALSNANYTLTQQSSATATITQAPLTITANNRQMTGGTPYALGTQAFSASGLKTTDAVAP